MVFKFMTYLYRKILSAGSTDKPADTQTHTRYRSKSSIMIGFVERNILCNEVFNIAMLFVFLSVAFKFLNRVTDCYKSGVNILTKLEALGRLSFQFQRLSNNNKEYMQTFEVWAILLTVHNLCATGSWKNVKIY